MERGFREFAARQEGGYEGPEGGMALAEGTPYLAPGEYTGGAVDLSLTLFVCHGFLNP